VLGVVLFGVVWFGLVGLVGFWAFGRLDLVAEI
jgi:hypothetical protein